MAIPADNINTALSNLKRVIDLLLATGGRKYAAVQQQDTDLGADIPGAQGGIDHGSAISALSFFVMAGPRPGHPGLSPPKSGKDVDIRDIQREDALRAVARP